MKFPSLDFANRYADRFVEKMGGKKGVAEYNKAMRHLQNFGTLTGCPAGVNLLDWASLRQKEARAYAHELVEDSNSGVDKAPGSVV